MARRNSEQTNWQTKKLDRGTGMTCPNPDCEGRVIVDVEQVREDAKSRGLSSMICPYCECSSNLPKKERR